MLDPFSENGKYAMAPDPPVPPDLLADLSKPSASHGDSLIELDATFPGNLRDRNVVASLQSHQHQEKPSKNPNLAKEVSSLIEDGTLPGNYDPLLFTPTTLLPMSKIAVNPKAMSELAISLPPMPSLSLLDEPSSFINPRTEFPKTMAEARALHRTPPPTANHARKKKQRRERVRERPEPSASFLENSASLGPVAPRPPQLPSLAAFADAALPSEYQQELTSYGYASGRPEPGRPGRPGREFANDRFQEQRQEVPTTDATRASHSSHAKSPVPRLGPAHMPFVSAPWPSEVSPPADYFLPPDVFV